MVPAPRLRLVAPALLRRSGPLVLVAGLLLVWSPGAVAAATAPATHQATDHERHATRGRGPAPGEARKIASTRCAAATPAKQPDPKARKPGLVKPDPKASKTDTKSDPKASKTDPVKSDPKASKTDTKPDPKASKTDPVKSDPKASKTDTKSDPKASKTDPVKSDPKASKTDPAKPDPKASKTDTKPDPKASKPDTAGAGQPAPVAAPPPPVSTTGGYWLGARLLGSPAAQAAALSDMSVGTGTAGAPDGAVAGQAPTMPEAMAWVARWAFAGAAVPAPTLEPADSPLHEGPAPIPGGAVFTAHGAIVHTLSVRGRNDDGSVRSIRWPTTTAELTPAERPWLPAVLLAERAPLFAAPAARVPPAAERFALARRSGSLWLLGHVDRCSDVTGERVCLRWAQVLARHGDEFHAGYLPASQVALVDGWKRGAGAAPRAQLLASGTRGARAQFLLVARTRDGGLHRRTIEAPLRGDAFPAARLRVDGEWATIELAGAPAQRIAVDPAMDARPR